MSIRSELSSVFSDDSLTSSGGACSTRKTQPQVTFDCCPACLQRFDFLKRATTSPGRVPLILPCKHTVCELCIYRGSTFEMAACPICFDEFPIPQQSKDRLCEIFTPHYSVIGYLVWTKNSLSKKQGTLKPTGFTLSGRQSQVAEREPPSQTLSDADSDDDDPSDKVELEFSKCPEHSEYHANIQCQTCQVQDDEAKKELSNFKSTAQRILRQLQITLEKVKGLKTFDVAHVETAIEMTFAALHARLHLAERAFKREVETSTSPEGLCSNEISNAIKSSMRKIRKILFSIDLVQSKQINVQTLLEEIRKLKSTPCKLVCEDGNVDPVRFVINDDFDDFEKCITIKKNMSENVRLVPMEEGDFMEDLSSLSSITSKAETDRNLKDGSSAAKLINNSVKSIQPPSHQQQKPDRKLPLQKGKKNGSDSVKRVIVTHVNDLNSFYVQDVTDAGRLAALNKKLIKSINECQAGGITMNKLYAVLYVTKKDVVWRRGKVLNEVTDKGTETSYYVLFVDYGNTQFVTKDKIKPLHIALSRQYPYASECKLINPLESNTWPDSVKFDFAQIVSDKLLVLKSSLPSDDKGVLEVDLLVPNSLGEHTSIIKILLEPYNLDGSLQTTQHDQTTSGSNRNLKFFDNSKTFKVGQIERVNITHVENPYRICIQLIENVQTITQMNSDLEKFYTSAAPASCVPVVKTDVIVNHSIPPWGLWHRGRITSMDFSNKTATVYFIDYGMDALAVPWSNIKLLTEAFVRVESQAIFVKLADVHPKQETWPEQAINFLKDKINAESSFRIAVSKVEPLEVALFWVTSDADICMNALLVDKGFALSTGNIANTVDWLHEPKKPEALKNDTDDISCMILKKTEEMVKHSNGDHDNRFKQQVKIAKCHSPDLIYIKFVANDKKEEQMHKELQIYYNKNREQQTEWSVSQECVIYYKKKNSYERASIKEEIENNTYLVYLFDLGREVIVPAKFLYPYATYFKKYPSFAYKCRLGNIKPAGDSGKWSHLATEMLQKMLETYRSVYVQKIDGDSNHRFMCVIMWYLLTTPGNALEPSKANFIEINKLLVESGVAFKMLSMVVSPSSANSRHTMLPIKDVDADISDDDGSINDYNATEDINNSKSPQHDKNCGDPIPEPIQDSLSSWLPPIPLTTTKFSATLKCIGDEGVLYVRDMASNLCYEDMEKRLKTYFERAKFEPKPLKWQPGDMCTIYWDGLWYRGNIIEFQNEDNIMVEMIDFGSSHEVTWNQLFKHVMYPDVPTLVNPIVLDGVVPRGGSWTKTDVDILFDNITDDITVELRSDPTVNIPSADVYVSTGKHFNKFIRRRFLDFEGTEDDEYNENLNDSSLSVIEEFLYIPLSDAIQEPVKMGVVNFIKYDMVVIDVLHEKSAHADKLASLNHELQKTAATQPILSNIVKGQTCICRMKSCDSQWRRAVVDNLDNLNYGYVSVLFVDHGLLDIVAVDDVRALLPDWLDLPVSNHVASVNVKLLNSNQSEFVLSQMKELCSKTVSVEIVSHTPLVVHLYNDDVLCYQHLVNCGMLSLL